MEWLENVVEDDDALEAWLGELARLVGGTPRPARHAVEFTIGPARFLVGLDVGPGTGGHPVLTPWVELTWSPSVGADVGGRIDVLRADTGTGQVTSVPGLRALATFGELATGGGPLLTGTPGVGSLRLGIGLDAHQRPVFALTVHDVDLPGPRHHDVLDLSSPEAALDAVDAVIGSALSAALDGFGEVGDLLKVLLGIDPPAGVSVVAATDVLADPLGALRGYWQDVVADAQAMSEVIGTLRRLLTGAPQAAAPGLGTRTQPWRLDLAEGVGLTFWRDGRALVVGLGARTSTDVLDDLTVSGTAAVELLRVDLTDGRTSFASTVSGEVSVAPRSVDSLVVDLTVARLRFLGLGVQAGWRAGSGLRVAMTGGGVELEHVDPRSSVPRVSPIPLPRIAANGSIEFTPDWAALESVLASLLGQARVPALDVVLDLLGWRGSGARLGLGALIADPSTAVLTWARDLALDCEHLRSVLGPIALVLSGGRLSAPLGSGRPDDPYRCPVAGEPRAPALAVWTVPGCPPVTAPMSATLPVDGLLDGLAPPTGPELAARLRESAGGIPDLADLLFARPRLGEGLTALMTRLAGTDGVVAPSIPSGVTARTIPGLPYASLSHACRTTAEALVAVTGPIATIVQIGSDSAWLDGVATSSAIDATGAVPPTLPATSTGTWFVRVADPVTAGSSHPDRDGVQAQADALMAVLRDRTSPVVLVAHGAAAAAALRAAAALPAVSTVVTVGAPWTPVSVLALTAGLSADALRFLDDLAGAELPPLPDAALTLTGSQFWRGAALVRRARSVTGAQALPSCAGEQLRPGLQVHALFGVVDARDVAHALTHLVVGATRQRQAALAAAVLATTGRPTELHAGIDLPVLDLDLAGLVVGVGARVDLLAVHRSAPTIRTLRHVRTTMRLGVTDGWLVGGPGADQSDVEVRWAELTLDIPLDGGEGACEIVLHDARAFAAHRERWVVRAGSDGVGATGVLPEVRILLSEIAGRLRTASPQLASLLTTLGVLRADGLDPGAIDRIVHDPASTLRPVVRAQAQSLAADLRALVGTTATGLGAGVVRLGGNAAYVDVDLATGAVHGSARLDLPDGPALLLTLTAGSGTRSLDVVVGTVDPALGVFGSPPRPGREAWSLRSRNDVPAEPSPPGSRFSPAPTSTRSPPC
ncbi:MAG: hypothetical protein IPM00_09160 [Tetrasphaera sp.]|nr:hypothetical protein [Tetrasphaera sp.]